jgi:hypothetical protein
MESVSWLRSVPPFSTVSFASLFLSLCLLYLPYSLTLKVCEFKQDLMEPKPPIAAGPTGNQFFSTPKTSSSHSNCAANGNSRQAIDEQLIPFHKFVDMSTSKSTLFGYFKKP